MIFGKALTASANSHDLAPLTLMSTDVDRIIDGLIALYSVWIRLLEVFVGIWLLWRQLGPVSIAPTLTVFAFFFIQTWASKSMGVLQARWVAAVQRRVTIATNIVRSMKSVKLAGLVESMEALLASEREREIAFAKAFRYILVGINMICKQRSLYTGIFSLIIPQQISLLSFLELLCLLVTRSNLASNIHLHLLHRKHSPHWQSSG